MKYIIDTNIWIYAAKGLEEAVRGLYLSANSEWAGFSSLTRLEVFGFSKLSKKDEELLSILLSEYIECDIDSRVIDQAIIIKQSHKIKTPDAIIAATALVYDSTLVTRNVSDFKNIPDIKVFNPFEETTEDI